MESDPVRNIDSGAHDMSEAAPPPRNLLTAAVAAIVLSALAPARAQTKPIEADANADWTHRHTRIALPAQIEGFSRQDIGDLTKDQLDISAVYQQSETRSWVTVYLYRAGLPDASVWHERAVDTIVIRNAGKIDRERATTSTFTPRGHGIDSGIRTTFPMLDPRITATGIAVFPHDDWLVKVRMSSADLTAERLDAALIAFIEAMAIPAPRVKNAAAYLIADCSEAMPTKKAERSAPDLADALIASAVWSEIEQREAANPSETSNKRSPRTLCRDMASVNDYGVYRDSGDGTKDRYLIAYGDAGIVITVGPDGLAGLMGKRRNAFSVVVSTVDARLIFTPFEGMPTPSQVVDLLGKEGPMTSVARGIKSLEK